MKITVPIKLIFFLVLCIATHAMAENISLPENIIIEKNYKPGFGLPVAKVLIAQGDVIIMHQQVLEGYTAQKGMLLYKSDTLFCLENSRASFKLNDGSILSLGSNTQMLISESIYDASHGKRASFLKMKAGKARFGITKLSNYNQSDFKVRTPTAIVGVRGSDFIIRAKKLLTEVVTFQDTVLEVVNLFAPDVMPVLLSEFEKVVVESEMLTSVVSPISTEDAESLKQEFIFDDNQESIDPIIPSVDDDTTSAETSTEPITQSDEIETPIVVVNIPDDDIVPPIETPEENEIALVTVEEPSEPYDPEIDDISEDIHEKNIKSEMPGLPGSPIR
jgi:hypothetical protein